MFFPLARRPSRRQPGLAALTLLLPAGCLLAGCGGGGAASSGGVSAPTFPASATQYAYMSQFSTRVSSQGNAAIFPSALALGPGGTIFVVNTGAVEAFGSDGTFLHEIGTQGGINGQLGAGGHGQLDIPETLAVDGGGRLYVTNYGNNAGLDTNSVVEFNPDGTFLQQFGGNGTASGQFTVPVGVAVDGGSVYVADAPNNRVEVFTTAGAFVRQFGGTGGDAGHLNGPGNVALDSGGSVYVSDTANHRVQKFSPNGAPLAQFGAAVPETGQLASPRGLAVDPGGSLYVADGDRIIKFRSDRTFLCQIGTAGSGDGQLSLPGGVAVDAAGNVYVADQNNNRVEVFRPVQ